MNFKNTGKMFKNIVKSADDLLDTKSLNKIAKNQKIIDASDARKAFRNNLDKKILDERKLVDREIKKANKALNKKYDNLDNLIRTPEKHSIEDISNLSKDFNSKINSNLTKVSVNSNDEIIKNSKNKLTSQERRNLRADKFKKEQDILTSRKQFNTPIREDIPIESKSEKVLQNRIQNNKEAKIKKEKAINESRRQFNTPLNSNVANNAEIATDILEAQKILENSQNQGNRKVIRNRNNIISRPRNGRTTEDIQNEINNIFKKETMNKKINDLLPAAVGGGILFAMANRGGQMTNSELYGQQSPYGY